MSYIILPHTADIRMRVKNKTLTDVFRDALLGMMAFMKPKGRISFFKKNIVKRRMHITGIDKTDLLIVFLNKVLYFSYTKGELYRDIVFHYLSDKVLKAEIKGTRGVSFMREIKAVTYHEAEIKQNKEGILETVIVFDI